MKLPAVLKRSNHKSHKNNFGHLLILAGSRSMLGAAALTGLSAMRSGAGLVSVGVPKSLNSTLQKKLSNVIMSVALNETREQTLSFSAYKKIQTLLKNYSALVLGPGVSRNISTKRLILKMIAKSSIPLVIDADALNALSEDLSILKQNKTDKILTPHPGEMSRLIKETKRSIEQNRKEVAENFSNKYNSTILLKGYHTVVAHPGHKTYINKTGNAGMATAGCGDVLTGMIGAFLAQGLTVFEAAKWGAYLHGKAGDLAAKKYGEASLIASDIIEFLPLAIQLSS